MPIGIRAGMFPLFVPVTHRWSRDGGRAMGIPKFVADLDFEEQADARAVRVFEGGRFILRLQVPSRGRVRILRQPMLTYASLDGRLLEAETPVLAHGRMRLAGRGAELELGDHPVADRLRGLGISSEAVGTLNWVAGRLILPTATPVGAARPYEGYLGTDRWFGRYTVQYPGTAPIDQYGYLTREGIEGAIVRGGGDLIGDYETIDADLGRPPMAGDTGTRPAEPVAVG
jgi:hypothetical protein